MLYSMSQKRLAVFFLFLWKQSSDTGGTTMPEVGNFIFRPEHTVVNRWLRSKKLALLSAALSLLTQ